MKRVLIIDDFFGREVPRGKNTERESLCRRLKLKEFDRREAGSEPSEPINCVAFFRGQTPARARVGDRVANDLPACLERAETGAPDGHPWDLLLVDLCFYTGDVTEESDAEFAGFPEGRSEDDDPSNFFGLQILSALRSQFPELPVVVFSAHSSPEVQSKVRTLGAHSFIARDDPQAQQRLAEILAEPKLPAALPPFRSAWDLLELVRKLPPPAVAELKHNLRTLKEIEALLIQRMLRGALSRFSQEGQEISLLPALKLITDNPELTTSQAADLVKRLIHQTRPLDATLLADPLIREAYDKSLRLRPGPAPSSRA